MIVVGLLIILIIVLCFVQHGWKVNKPRQAARRKFDTDTAIEVKYMDKDHGEAVRDIKKILKTEAAAAKKSEIEWSRVQPYSHMVDLLRQNWFQATMNADNSNKDDENIRREMNFVLSLGDYSKVFSREAWALPHNQSKNISPDIICCNIIIYILDGCHFIKNYFKIQTLGLVKSSLRIKENK